ncbi:MAG: glycoside hydrolase family 48, partial [Marmoricola sp.]|nr:glycoside hydrolase family 48 [Marmoricola sp.]
METKSISASQEQVLLDKLRGLEGQVHVNAFAPHLASIQRLKAANPMLDISLVTYSPVLPVPDGISGQDLESSYVTAERVAELHAAGMTVRAWVPNSVTAWQDLRDMGVDAIMTNSTSAYVKWAATQCGVSPPAPPGAADQTGPSVTASLPGDTATVSDTVQVTGIASDDGGVESVSLLVDGVAVTSSAPGNDGTVAFDWNSAAVPNGTHTLQLQARDVAGNLGHSSVVSVTVQNIDVANLTTYAYHVTALDAAGNESAPSEPTDIQTGDDTAPTVPTVSAALSGTDGVEVSWSASTDNAGVAGYRVFRSGALTAIVDTATSTLLDTGLGDGIAYTYRVVAFDASGNASAPSSPVTVTTPDRTAPSSPGGLSAVSGMQSVALSWTAAGDNVGVTGYVVHRDGESLATLGGAARSYTDTGLDGTTAHRYQVTAIDAAGPRGSGEQRRDPISRGQVGADRPHRPDPDDLRLHGPTRLEDLGRQRRCDRLHGLPRRVRHRHDHHRDGVHRRGGAAGKDPHLHPAG